MNQLVIIGNLTRAPELRQTQDGTPVCNFTVAVNRRVRAGANPEADYFRVTAWRGLGENCNRYLEKGRKVAVTGTVSARAYTGNDGGVRASLEVTAKPWNFYRRRGATATKKALPKWTTRNCRKASADKLKSVCADAFAGGAQ